MVLYMQNFCRCHRRSMSRRWLLRAAVLLGVVCAMPLGLAQTLARPGWVGSGMTPNVWWRHAIVYAVDLGASESASASAGGGLKAVAGRMDALQTLGVDAVLLRGLQAGAGIDAAATGGGAAGDATAGT